MRELTHLRSQTMLCCAFSSSFSLQVIGIEFARKMIEQIKYLTACNEMILERAGRKWWKETSLLFSSLCLFLLAASICIATEVGCTFTDQQRFSGVVFFLSFIFDEICVLGKVQVLHKTVFLYLFFLYFGADAIFPSFLLFCLILLCFFFAFLSPSLSLFFSVCLLWEIAPSPFRQACVALPFCRICGISLKTCFQRDSKMALNVSVLLQSVILCHHCATCA